MKAKRRRTIPPDKVREAIMGGIYRDAIKQKECSGCGELRNSVDDSGLCGYCRAVHIVRK